MTSLETQALTRRKAPGLLRLLARYRGAVFNLCLAALIPLAQPVILQRLFVGIDRNRADLPLGIALIVLQLLELLALRWKFAALGRRLSASFGGARASTPVLILWIFHLGVSTALLYPILKAFGLDPNQADDPLRGGTFLLLVALMVVKELLVLLAINPRQGGRAKPGGWRYQELAADAMLLVFTGVAYMLLLDVAGARQSLLRADSTQLAVNLIITAIFALLALLPLRMAYLVEEWETLRTPLDMLVFIVSLAIVLVVTAFMLV